MNMEKWKLAAFAIALAGIVYANAWGFGQSFGMRAYGADAPCMNGGWLAKNITSEQIGEFRSAILSGDWETAKKLHSEYGLGGPIFDRLNSSTFATFSQIANMRKQAADLQIKLNQDLGIGNQAAGIGFKIRQMGRFS
jgi:hypothetical protein